MTTAHAPEAPAAKSSLDESIKTLRSELATSPQDDQAYYDERFNALVEEHGLSADLCLAFAGVERDFRSPGSLAAKLQQDLAPLPPAESAPASARRRMRAMGRAALNKIGLMGQSLQRTVQSVREQYTTKGRHEKPASHKLRLKFAGAVMGLMGVGAAATGLGGSHELPRQEHSYSAEQASDDTTAHGGPIELASHKVLIGGMGDKTGQFLRSVMAAGGENMAGASLVEYPASAAPIGGVDTFDQSVTKGSEAAYNVIQAERAAGNPVDISAYSQGTVVLQRTLERLRQENGGNLPPDVHATYFASPNTPHTGLYNAGLFQAAKPVLGPLGAQKELEDYPLQPGTATAAMTTDVVANSANRPLTTQLSLALGYAFGDGHAKPSQADIADTTRTTTRQIDGVTVHSVKPVGTQTAALRAAEQHGMLVTPTADKFGQALAPQGDVGGENPGVNMDEVVKTGAQLIDETAQFHGMANPHLAEAAANVQGLGQIGQGEVNSDANQGGGEPAQDIASQVVAGINQANEAVQAAQGEAVGSSEQVYAASDIASQVQAAGEQFQAASEQVQQQVDAFIGAQAPQGDYYQAPAAVPVQEAPAPVIAPIEVPQEFAGQVPQEAQNAVNAANQAINDINNAAANFQIPRL